MEGYVIPQWQSNINPTTYEEQTEQNTIAKQRKVKQKRKNRNGAGGMATSIKENLQRYAKKLNKLTKESRLCISKRKYMGTQW